MTGLLSGIYQLIRAVLAYLQGKETARAERRKSNEVRSGSIQRLVVSITEMNAELVTTESLAEKVRQPGLPRSAFE